MSDLTKFYIALREHKQGNDVIFSSDPEQIESHVAAADECLHLTTTIWRKGGSVQTHEANNQLVTVGSYKQCKVQ